MLKLGTTRIELGVQSVFDEPLFAIHRGHTLKDNIRSIRELKDLGFKINFHYMLSLPGISKDKAIEGFAKLFNDPDFKHDMVKLYPCMVLEGTPIHEEWKKGKFIPSTTTEAAERIAEFKKIVPKYCRIMRVQRDIPTYRTEAGVDKTNWRQYVDALTKKEGITCNCIRCREIKRSLEESEEVIYETHEYDATGGKEFFIESKNEDE